MIENVENPILEQLLAIRADMSAMKEEMSGMRAEMLSVRQHMAGLLGTQTTGSSFAHENISVC